MVELTSGANPESGKKRLQAAMKNVIRYSEMLIRYSAMQLFGKMYTVLNSIWRIF
jgi:hypothetical protein